MRACFDAKTIPEIANVSAIPTRIPSKKSKLRFLGTIGLGFFGFVRCRIIRVHISQDAAERKHQERSDLKDSEYLGSHFFRLPFLDGLPGALPDDLCSHIPTTITAMIPPTRTAICSRAAPSSGPFFFGVAI